MPQTLFWKEMNNCLNYIGKFQDRPQESEAEAAPQTPADEKMLAVFKATQDGKNKKSENVCRMPLTQAAILQQFSMTV